MMCGLCRFVGFWRKKKMCILDFIWIHIFFGFSLSQFYRDIFFYSFFFLFILILIYFLHCIPEFLKLICTCNVRPSVRPMSWSVCILDEFFPQNFTDTASSFYSFFFLSFPFLIFPLYSWFLKDEFPWIVL